jgi:CRISPR-associated exonuclease Cas4
MIPSMDDIIQISKLNDFVYSPETLYLHQIYEGFDVATHHDLPQTRGRLNHETIDNGEYSSSKHLLQSTTIYCEKYGLVGKIDIFDSKKHHLIERKTLVKTIYPGYKYQLWAQMFALQEMGYTVLKLFVHSLTDNKRYPIDKPNPKELEEFETLIANIRTYDPLTILTHPEMSKTAQISIYKELGF